MNQPRNLGNMPWSDVYPDDCICNWVNYSDSTGWFRKSTNPLCRIHGDEEESSW